MQLMQNYFLIRQFIPSFFGDLSFSPPLLFFFIRLLSTLFCCLVSHRRVFSSPNLSAYWWEILVGAREISEMKGAVKNAINCKLIFGDQSESRETRSSPGDVELHWIHTKYLRREHIYRINQRIYCLRKRVFIAHITWNLRVLQWDQFHREIPFLLAKKASFLLSVCVVVNLYYTREDFSFR